MARKKKKKLTLAELKRQLDKLKLVVRSSIKPTKVFRDKTKYSRKKKHEGSDQ